MNIYLVAIRIDESSFSIFNKIWEKCFLLTKSLSIVSWAKIILHWRKIRFARRICLRRIGIVVLNSWKPNSSRRESGVGFLLTPIDRILSASFLYRLRNINNGYIGYRGKWDFLQVSSKNSGDASYKWHCNCGGWLIKVGSDSALGRHMMRRFGFGDRNNNVIGL